MRQGLHTLTPAKLIFYPIMSYIYGIDKELERTRASSSFILFPISWAPKAFEDRLIAGMDIKDTVRQRFPILILSNVHPRQGWYGGQNM